MHICRQTATKLVQPWQRDHHLLGPESSDWYETGSPSCGSTNIGMHKIQP